MIFFLFLFIPTHTQAFSFTPALIDISGNPGDVLHTKIEFKNSESTSSTTTFSTANFSPKDESGTPVIVTDTNVTGLPAWITIPEPLKLKPKEKQSIPITITIPKDAHPGGYYAAIVGNVQHTATSDKNENTVGALSQGAILVLLKVNGEIRMSQELKDFGTTTGEHFYSQLPIEFMYRVGNFGASHIRPDGLIIMTSLFGRYTASLPANVSHGVVLPGMTRRFANAWGTQSSLRNPPTDFLSHVYEEMRTPAFGIYRANLHLKVDGVTQPVQSYTIWILPYHLLLLLSAFLLLVGAVCYGIYRRKKLLKHRMHRE